MPNHQEIIDLMNEAQQLRDQVSQLTATMDKMWRSVIEYPFSQVCKHLVASNMLSEMEKLGFEVTKEVADSVVKCDDEAALAHPPLVYRGLPTQALDNDLVERCKELLDWKNTGFLNEGKGGAIRKLAKSLDHIPQIDRLRAAERITIDEALKFFAAQLPAPEPSVPDEEPPNSFGM